MFRKAIQNFHPRYIKQINCTYSFSSSFNLNNKQMNISKVFQCRKYCITPSSKYYNEQKSNGVNSRMFFSFGLFVLLGLEEPVEEESELVLTIKRAVLAMQRDEYEKAERILHIALKMAQDIQNEDGITYVYDVMANLALTQKQYDKAEKLFVDIMQRLMRAGVKENDNKILHISLKMAKIAEEKTDFKRAQIGYEFCLNHLQKKLDDGAQDRDTLELCAMTNDWYARLLLKEARYDDAFIHFKRSYKLCKKIHGEVHEHVVQLLNDMGTISFHRGNQEKTIKYLEKAVRIGKHLPEMDEFSSILINLAHVYMKLKILDKAKEYCDEGIKNAKRHKNEQGIKEGNVCLEELGRTIPA